MEPIEDDTRGPYEDRVVEEDEAQAVATDDTIQAVAEATADEVAAEAVAEAEAAEAVAAAPAVAAPTTPDVTIEYETSGDPDAGMVLESMVSRETLKKILPKKTEIGELTVVNALAGGSTTEMRFLTFPVGMSDRLKARKYVIDRELKLRITTRVPPASPTAESTSTVKTFVFYVLHFQNGQTARADTDPVDLLDIKYPGNWTVQTDPYPKVVAKIEAVVRAIGVRDRKILVCNSGGVPATPADEKTFIIEINGSRTPASGNAFPTPATMFGVTHPRAGENLRYVPSLELNPLFDPTGQECGCYDTNGVYFYAMAPVSDVAIANILCAALDALEAAWKAPTQENMNDESCRRYVSSTVEYADRELKDVEKALPEVQARVRDTYSTHMIQVTEEVSLLNKLNLLKNDRANYSLMVETEFAQFLKMDQIKDVYWRGTALCFRTRELCATDPRTGHLHSIGEFTIVLDSTSGQPRWFNTTRRVHGMREKQMAPHVWADGLACLGSVSGVLPRLLATRKYYACALVCLAFIESVNVDDGAGAHIHKWPIRRLKAGVAVSPDSGKLLSE